MTTMPIPVASLIALLASFCSAVSADQNAPELPALFDALANAGSAAQTVEIESRIWALWLEAPDEASTRKMTRIVLAMQNDDLEQALALSDQLVKSAPDFAEGLNKRATIHYLMGDHDRSVVDIGKVLSLEPRHFGAISGLGLIFLQRGDLEAALEAFEQVLQISPHSRSARRSAERVRDELGNEI